MGRARKGTGLAGSETYSSKAGPDWGAVKLSLLPGFRYSGRDGAIGHLGNWRHSLVPVSKAVTGAIECFGAASCR